MHFIQANIEVMIFTLICSEYKTVNSTGLKQLHLKVLDNPLLHGCLLESELAWKLMCIWKLD